MVQNKFLFFLYFVIIFISAATAVAQGSSPAIKIPLTEDLIDQLEDIVVTNKENKGMSPSTPLDQPESEPSVDNPKNSDSSYKSPDSSSKSSDSSKSMNKQGVAPSPIGVVPTSGPMTGPIKSPTTQINGTPKQSINSVNSIPTPKSTVQSPPPKSIPPPSVVKAPLPPTSTSKVSHAEHISTNCFLG
ncbi:9322_t:CDS:1, partial [Cetraspora pellucida]